MPFFISAFLSDGRMIQVWQRKMQKKTTLAAKKPERGPKNAAKVEIFCKATAVIALLLLISYFPGAGVGAITSV